VFIHIFCVKAKYHKVLYTVFIFQFYFPKIILHFCLPTVTLRSLLGKQAELNWYYIRTEFSEKTSLKTKKSSSLIEISWIYRSAGTPLLVLSTLARIINWLQVICYFMVKMQYFSWVLHHKISISVKNAIIIKWDISEKFPEFFYPAFNFHVIKLKNISTLLT
jgi:hypothetical protein